MYYKTSKLKLNKLSLLLKMDADKLYVEERAKLPGNFPQRIN